METVKKVFSDDLSAFRKGYNTQYVLMLLVEKIEKCLGPVQELWYTPNGAV